jgi:hypothetical protein
MSEGLKKALSLRRKKKAEVEEKKNFSWLHGGRDSPPKVPLHEEKLKEALAGRMPPAARNVEQAKAEQKRCRSCCGWFFRPLMTIAAFTIWLSFLLAIGYFFTVTMGGISFCISIDGDGSIAVNVEHITTNFTAAPDNTTALAAEQNPKLTQRMNFSTNFDPSSFFFSSLTEN